MDKKEKLLIEIVCIIVLSNFLCMFCFLFLNLAFQGNMEELASILSLVISFVIMPFYVLKKQHNIKISEIGIAKISKIHKIIFFLIFSTSLYKYMHHKLYIKCTTIGGYNFFVYILNTASIMPAGNLYTKLLKKSPPVCSANPKIIALTITT